MRLPLGRKWLSIWDNSLFWRDEYGVLIFSVSIWMERQCVYVNSGCLLFTFHMIEMKWWCFNSLFCLLSQCLVWESVGPTDHLVCEEAIPSEGAINWNYRCLYYFVNICFFLFKFGLWISFCVVLLLLSLLNIRLSFNKPIIFIIIPGYFAYAFWVYVCAWHIWSLYRNQLLWGKIDVV